MTKWAKVSFLEQGNQRIEYMGEVQGKITKTEATVDCPGVGVITAPIESSGASTVTVLDENPTIAEATEFNVRNSGQEKSKAPERTQRKQENPKSKQTKQTEGEKTYTVAGVSFYRGEYQVRVANNKNRGRVLEKNGHEDVKMVELPYAMTKQEARNYLRQWVALTEAQKTAI